jgi:hypothetical protein
VRDQELERRVLDMRAVASEQLEGPVLETFGWLICDGCGMRVRISSDPDRPQVHRLREWGEGPEGDLCPTCVEQRS